MPKKLDWRKIILNIQQAENKFAKTSIPFYGGQKYQRTICIDGIRMLLSGAGRHSSQLTKCDVSYFNAFDCYRLFGISAGLIPYTAGVV